MVFQLKNNGNNILRTKTTDRVPNMCNVVCFALSLLIFIQIHRNYIKNLTVNYTNFFVIKRIYKCGNTLWKLKYRFIPLDIFAIFFYIKQIPLLSRAQLEIYIMYINDFVSYQIWLNFRIHVLVRKIVLFALKEFLISKNIEMWFFMTLTKVKLYGLPKLQHRQ